MRIAALTTDCLVKKSLSICSQLTLEGRGLAFIAEVKISHKYLYHHSQPVTPRVLLSSDWFTVALTQHIMKN